MWDVLKAAGQWRERTWWWLLLGAGLALRLAALVALPHVPESDETAYLEMARNFAAGQGFLENGNRAFYNAGYPMFVLVPVFTLLGENLLVMRLLNVALGMVAVVLCHRVAKEAGAGQLGRLLAMGFWALYLPTGVYAVYIAKENLMVPLMLGVTWCALRLLRAPQARPAALAGLLFGLLALTGNAALSLAGMMLVALCLTPGGWFTRMRLGLLMLGVGVLVALPWALRNADVVGAPVLNTNGGFNLYLGNNPAATGYFISVANTPLGKQWLPLRARVGEVQAAQVLRQEAVKWIQSHPAEFAVLALRKGLYFWTPPFHLDDGASLAEVVVRAAWTLQFCLMVGLAVWAICRLRHQPRSVWLLILALAGYTAVHMLFYVIYRYREPIMPLVAVMAALALEAWVLRRRGSGHRQQPLPGVAR